MAGIDTTYTFPSLSRNRNRSARSSQPQAFTLFGSGTSEVEASAHMAGLLQVTGSQTVSEVAPIHTRDTRGWR